MALLKAKEAKNMPAKEREEKIKEFRSSLIRAQVTANRASAKTKEIKRSIARLLTFAQITREVSKHKQ